MTDRSMHRGLPASLALGAVFLLATSLPAQRDFADVEVTALEVAGDVWMITGSGGNLAASVGEDGILLVDSQFAPLAPKIRAALEQIGGEEAPKFLLNTHWHGDHTGGNPTFGAAAVIVAHDNVRRRLMGEGGGRVSEPPLTAAGLPVITFGDGLSVHFNGERIRVEHRPEAHTDGDAIVWFEGSGVVHLGDLFFQGRFPFVDLDSGGSVRGLLHHVEDLLERIPPETRIIPGHGDLSGVQELREYHRMLVDSVRIVERRLRAGKSLEEIQAMGMPERYERWGDHFISEQRWLGILVQSLSKE